MATCQLLDKLPLELREAIYIESLSTSDPIKVHTDENGMHINHPDSNTPFQLPSLLSTNRQIRSEARKFFFSTNTFHITMSENLSDAMLTPVKFLSSLPLPDRKALKHCLITFKYAGFEGSMRAWSDVLDELVAEGQDPMTAFAHLPCHLYHTRRGVLTSALEELRDVEGLDLRIVRFEVEEFDGDMFPYIWKQCWGDVLEEMEGVFGGMVVKKVSAKETRPPGCTCGL